MTTANLTKLWAQDFDKIWFDNFKLVPAQSPEFFNEADAGGKHYIRRGLMVNLGAMQSMDEGTPIPFDSMLDGPEKTVYPAKFGLQLQATHEAMQDDRQGILKQSLAMLGQAQKYTIELAAWDILNSGFGTTRLGVDGLALFTASHTQYGVAGGTLSNLATGSLSKTTLEAAITRFRKMVDERNKPIIMEPRVLIIPPELEWKAKELLMSPYDPETANRNINPLYDVGIKYFICRFLTSTTAWFLVTEKAFHDLQLVWFTRPKSGTYNDENVEAAIFKVSMRMLATFWNWRGCIGSTGV
jgi:hypothetical protein